jgi:hypothetical protein
VNNTKRYLKNLLLIFFFAVVAVIESVWILKSNGFYLVDECAHFLYSRFVLSALPVTVQTWHRPGRLWLFALPAQFGHTVTMFFSLALFLCLLLLVFKIAKLKGIKHAEWVVLLTGLQPVLFDISYACLTEAPTALVITLSYWYHLKGKHGWSLTVASAVFLFRFEMYAYAILLFFVYLHRREWKILPLVLLGPLVWIGLSTLISGDVLTFFREWSHFSSLGKFIPGVSLTHYVANLYKIFGFAQVVFFAAGVGFIARANRNADFGIIYCTIFIDIVFHTLAGAEVLHWTGSIGELRYIAVVGPFFGIVSVYGLSEFFERAKPLWRQFALSVIVFSVIVFQCTVATHPRRWPNYEQVVINMVKASQVEYPDITLLSNNCAAAYVMDVAPSGGPHYAKLDKAMLQKYPECLILWDPFAANSLFFQTELTKEKILQDTTIVVLGKYNYWSVEYLLLYRNTHGRPLGINMHGVNMVRTK